MRPLVGRAARGRSRPRPPRCVDVRRHWSRRRCSRRCTVADRPVLLEERRHGPRHGVPACVDGGQLGEPGLVEHEAPGGFLGRRSGRSRACGSSLVGGHASGCALETAARLKWWPSSRGVCRSGHSSRTLRSCSAFGPKARSSSRVALARTASREASPSASPLGRVLVAVRTRPSASRISTMVGRPAGYPASRSGACSTSTLAASWRTGSLATSSSVRTSSSRRPCSSDRATAVGMLKRASSSFRAGVVEGAGRGVGPHADALHVAGQGRVGVGRPDVIEGVEDAVEVRARGVQLDVAAQDLVVVRALGAVGAAGRPSARPREGRGSVRGRRGRPRDLRLPPVPTTGRG